VTVLALWLSLPSHLGVLVLMAALSALAAVAQVVVPPGGAGPGGDGDPNPGDGGDPGGDGADPADGGDPDAGGRTAAGRDGADPDDDGGDDDDIDALPEQNVRTRLRRLQRTVRERHDPILGRFRGPDGRLMDARQVDDMLSRARDMEQFEQVFQNRPDLLQQVLEAAQGKGGRAAQAAAQEVLEEAFDDANIPFETETESGKYLRNLAKTVHELKAENKRLAGQLGQVNEREGTRTLASIENAWKSRTLAAIKDLPEEYKLAVVDRVQARFDVLRANRQLGRVRPDEIIRKALEPYQRLLKGRSRTAVAGQQARATNNQQRPAAVTRGTAVARPGDTNNSGKETIRDARKSFFARTGSQPLPGGRK
jgi:hypothetical protein